MTNSPAPGIFLITEFDWPDPFEPQHGQKAGQLHEVVQNQTWIREVAAASGGIGAGASSIWIFWLESYAALDRLLTTPDDPICAAYVGLLSAMVNVSEKVRQEVLFG